MDILERILQLLSEQGNNQVDLADYLCISKNNISDWKQGRSKSYKKYLYQIAEFLGTTPEYLRGETDVKYKHVNSGIIVGDKNKIGSINQGQILTDNEQELLKGFRELSITDQARVLVYVAELKK